MMYRSRSELELDTLAEVVHDSIDPELDIVYDDPRTVDADHTPVETEETRAMIGYGPTRDIRTGVAEFIEWYRRNRDWYEPLVLNS